MNPSLLMGRATIVSARKVVLDFMARKINAVPNGGLNFVDVRDTAQAFRVAMEKGRHGERYLLGAVNWTFVKFFDRLERLTKIASPRLAFPSKFAITGAHVIDSLFRQWNLASPLEADTVEMAEHFWYFNHNKARRELNFDPRDPGDTLSTVQYVREFWREVMARTLRLHAVEPDAVALQDGSSPLTLTVIAYTVCPARPLVGIETYA